MIDDSVHFVTGGCNPCDLVSCAIYVDGDSNIESCHALYLISISVDFNASEIAAITKDVCKNSEADSAHIVHLKENATIIYIATCNNENGLAISHNPHLLVTLPRLEKHSSMYSHGVRVREV